MKIINIRSSMASTSIDWEKSKKSALEKINKLSAYTPEQIVKDYENLLEAIQSPEYEDMELRLKAFQLHERFERFALSYTFLFNLAVKRSTPVSVSNVRQMLEISQLQKDNKMTDEEARVAVMRLARPDL